MISARSRLMLALVVCSLLAATLQAAAPTADQALKLAPVQKEIEYDRPTAVEAGKCTIKAEKVGGLTGWVVRDAGNHVLREFVDTNNDNVVDRWGYFYDGVEVYRDIDSDFNGRADQCRWLNTAGTRWGIDKNEDGIIDSWKVISAEETSAEVVASVKTRDAARFGRLLLTPAELKSLGLGDAKVKEISTKIAAAPNYFADLVKTQKAITDKTNWVHFGGTRPGLIPAGTAGSTADLVAYENVVAMIETQNQPGQLVVGALIRLGDTWRVIDAPQITAGATNELSAGVFFAPHRRTPNATEVAPGGPSEKAQQLLADLEKIDDSISKSRSAQDKSTLHDRRAEIMEQLVNEAGDKDRAQWVKQLADTVSAAVQGGEYTGGVERLKKLSEKLAQEGTDPELAAYVQFRFLSAEYGQNLQAPGADFSKVQSAWLESLEKFVEANPKSPDTSEALLQLAVAQEFAGQEDKAKGWHQKIVSGFPGTPAAKKASGAITRLECVGKPIQLKGKTPAGAGIDLAQLKGKVVLIQYWATWCEPAKADMAQIKEMLAKYGRGFTVVGVSLDNTQQSLVDYLQQNRLPWPQVFEPGGLDSRLANEMGILTLPTMLLVDTKGNVVNRSVHASELDSELKNLVKDMPAAAPAPQAAAPSGPATKSADRRNAAPPRGGK